MKEGLRPRLTVSLLQQMRETYLAMPSLRLSLAGAMALWHLDAVTCDVAIRVLVEEGFLARTPGEHIVRRSGSPYSPSTAVS